MRDLDASAFDTHDCSVPGCPDEARERGGLCSYHATSSDRPTLVAPGSHAHLMEEETPVNTCRMPGCTNASAGKGGWCVGLCDEHISIEGTRRQAVRRERLQAEKPQKPKAVKPPPGSQDLRGRSNDHVHTDARRTSAGSRRHAPGRERGDHGALPGESRAHTRARGPRRLRRSSLR